MATEAHRRVMLVSASSGTEEPPASPAPNLFAPISTENRITGQPRARRQRVQAQLTPGSSYDYGRPAYGGGEDRPESLMSEEEALGYQKSVPPTFLRRTLLSDHRPLPPPGWGAGLAYPPADGAYPMIPMAQPAPEAAIAPPAQVAPVTGAAPWAGVPLVAAGDAHPSGYPADATYPPQPGRTSETATPATPFWMNAPTTVWHAIPAAKAYPEASAVPQPLATQPPAPVATAGERRRRGTAERNSPLETDHLPQQEPAPLPEAVPPAPPPQPRRRRASQPRDAAVPQGVAAPRATAAHWQPETVLDPWEAMGWKAHEPSTFETTSVMRLADLTMFERGAFEEPPNPYDFPPETNRPYGTATGDLYCLHPMEPGARAAGPAPEHPAAGQLYDEYAAAAYVPAPRPLPYIADLPLHSGMAEEPAHYSDGYGADGAAYTDVAAPEPAPAHKPHRATPTPQHNEPRSAQTRQPGAQHRAKQPPQRRQRKPRFGFSLSALGPTRTALLIGVSLALLFVLVEGFKIAQNLFSGEEQMKQYQNEYYRLTGQDAAAAVSGVELLPAGQTYTPTATPVPVTTPTPTPRVDQNDPLIGVVDGERAQTTFQAALPTATAASRTRLTQYPENPLLSISEDFTALRSENPDVVGHLTIDGVLDETVVQRNNTFYLTHNARGLFGDGAVFVDESVVLKKPPENLLLRGKVTADGKLFSALTRYGTEGAPFIQQHGIITFDTIYEKARYVVFAVVNADSRTDSQNYFNYAGYPVFQSDAQMLRYVEAACKRSAYNINVNVQPGDRLLTLATISEGSDTSCWVILCRMLRNGETPDSIGHN